jgi:hypothetical protein
MTTEPPAAATGAKPISVYQHGWARGCWDARQVLNVGGKGYSTEMRFAPEAMPDGALLPMTVAERADWLNGYSAGIKHIALNAAIKEYAEKRS